MRRNPATPCAAVAPCDARAGLPVARLLAVQRKRVRMQAKPCRPQERLHYGPTDSGTHASAGWVPEATQAHAAVIRKTSSPRQLQPMPCLDPPFHLCAWSEGSSAQVACQPVNRCSFLRSLSDLRVWMRTRPEAAFAKVAARQATPRPPYLHVAAFSHTHGNTSHHSAARPVSVHGDLETATAAAAESAARLAHSSTSFLKL